MKILLAQLLRGQKVTRHHREVVNQKDHNRYNFQKDQVQPNHRLPTILLVVMMMAAVLLHRVTMMTTIPEKWLILYTVVKVG